MHFIYPQCSEENLIAPKLAATVSVDFNLNIRLFVYSTLVPKTVYKHLISLETVSSITEFCNILALCKVLSQTAESDKRDFTSLLNLAISSFQRAVALGMKMDSSDFDVSSLP